MASSIPTAADVRKVAPASIPGVRVSPESFGSQIGQATQELGGAAFELGIKMRNTAEKAEAQDLANKMSEYTRILEMGNDLPDGDANQIIGYRSLQGLNAVNKRGEYEQKLLDERERLEGLATSDRVKRMFNPVAQNHVNRSMTAFGTISIREQKVYEEKVALATIQASTNGAVANSSDDAIVRGHVSAVWDVALDRAKKLYGNSPSSTPGVTMAQVYALTEVTKVHKAVFDDLLRDNPKAAEAYLAELKKNEKIKSTSMRMDPAELSKLEEQAETRTRVVLAQDTVDELDSSNILDPLALKTKKQKAMWNLKTLTPEARAAKGDLAEPHWQKVARNFVQKNFEGKDETAVSEELEKRIRQAVQNKGFRRDQAASAAMKHVLGLGVPKQTLKSFLSDPKNEEHAKLLGHASMASFLTFLRKETGKIEFRTHSDNTTFAALRSNLSVLAKTDLEIKRGSLTKGEHDKLVNLKAGELAKLNLVEQGHGQILKDGATFVSKAAPKGWPTHRAHKYLVQEAEGEMRVWIGNYVRQHTALPSYELMRRQATRMWLHIMADPDNTGRGYTPEKGEEDITLRAFQADNLYALSAQQREVARVPFKQISDAFKTEIRLDLARSLRDDKHPAPDVIADALSEEDYENLAAATLLGDRTRVRRIEKQLVVR